MDIVLASPYISGSLVVTKNGSPVPGDIVDEDPDAGTFTLNGTSVDDEIVVCYQPQTNDAPPADLAQDGGATHGTSSRVTRCDHQHEHGDLSGSAGPHHSADQITGLAGAPAAHAASHEDGGSDEIDVTGLVGAGSPSEILAIPTAETDDTLRLAPDGVGGVEWAAGGGGGAPDDATYLVGAAHAGLSAEIVVGATPGGELGNTWASPTVDATHSGSTHAAAQAAAEATAAGADAAHVAAADPHAVYLKESDFDDIDFLVGTATGFTAAEIVVGTSPAGELGGTWASPTIDATHSGSSHAGLAGVYNVALQGFVSMYASLGAGTYSLLGYEAGANAVASGVAGPIAVFRLTAAELSVSGLTPKLNIQAYVACSGTTPGAGWTATYGLYPITSSGTTNLAFTAGTVVTGSTAAPAWAINTIAVAASGDFTLPADGAYGLYVVTNQALASNMVVRTGAKVRFRNV